jgi:sugar fermentation stimulation protein A
MKFPTPLIPGTLIQRYKRFFADVRLADGTVVAAHCPNTGSMTGCAVPGSPVYLSVSDNPTRKLPYTLEIVDVGTSLVGVNTSLTNRLAEEAIRGGVLEGVRDPTEIRREVPIGDSRIDLLLLDGDRRCYIEVKNVTLWDKGTALFPDAVTTRGTKHLRELHRIVGQGHRAVICFVVQREDCTVFAPADRIDPVYGETLREVTKKGVEILVCQARVRPEEIRIDKGMPYRL